MTIDAALGGQLAALTSAALWAVASLLFAAAGRTVPPLALNLLKCLVALILLGLTLVVTQGRAWPTALGLEGTLWLAASGLMGLTAGDTAYLTALNRLGPRRTLLMWALIPPATAVLAVPILAEPLTATMAAGIGLTVGGVCWVVMERTAPGTAGSTGPVDTLGVLAGLAAVGCQAGGNVLTKLGGGAIDALDIAVVRLTFGVAGLVLVLAWRGMLRPALAVLQRPTERRQVLLAAFLGTYLGIWLSMAGLRYALVGVAATLNSTSPLFVLPLSRFVLGERLSLRAVLGAVLAVVGVAVLFMA